VQTPYSLRRSARHYASCVKPAFSWEITPPINDSQFCYISEPPKQETGTSGEETRMIDALPEDTEMGDADKTTPEILIPDEERMTPINLEVVGECLI